MKQLLFLVFFISVAINSSAQIGIGTTTPHPSAELDVSSTSRGLLLPRMNTLQRKAIADPAVGLLVFDTDKNSLFLYDGAKWTAVGTFTDNNIPAFTRNNSQGQVNDHLGFSVAMDSNYAFVGAPLDSITGTGKQGAVYVLKKDPQTGWQFLAKLTGQDVAAGDYLGYAVSMHGDYAIAGTYKTAGLGAAYIFVRNGDTWTQQAKLTATDGVPGDMFGASVSIYDNYAVVGAPKDDEDSVDCGSVYIFTRTGTTWTQQVKITAADKTRFDQFGQAVSVHGNNLLIVASGDSLPVSQFGDYKSGSVYPYVKNGNTWLPLRKLWSPASQDIAWTFANALSVTNTYAVITDWNSQRAFAYRYADTGWVYESSLTRPANSTAMYGTCVSLSGEYLAVGGITFLPPGISTIGYVFCYQRSGNTWSLIKSINRIDATSGNFTLGRSVAIDENTLDVLIGAPGSFEGSEINQRVPVKGAFYIVNLQ